MRLLIIGLVIVLSASIVGGCAPPPAEPVAVPTAQPTAVPTMAEVETPGTPTEVAVQVPDPARARDAALGHVAANYGEQATAQDLAWVEETITPEGLVGASTFQYTAGGWVVTVSFPVVAPQATIYTVVMDNQATGFHWEGEVDAAGQVTETSAPRGGLPVAGWLGHVVSNPPGSQYDDYLVLQPEGAGEIGVEGVKEAIQAEIVALRDHEEPGKYAHFWGSLICDVPDYGGCQLVVTRVRAGTDIADPEPVEAWEGAIVSNPPGSQFEDYFFLAGDFPVGYGIDSIDPAVEAQLESLRDPGITARVWGQLRTGVPDAFGSQIEVTRVEGVGDPLAPPLAPTPVPEQGATEPVQDWTGVIVSNPPGSQFDDYFEWQSVVGGRYGIDSLDEGIRQQITALRDTGTTVRVWGTLHRDVPDMNGTQIQVTRLDAQEPSEPPEMTGEPVEAWVGTVVKLPPGFQLGHYFRREDGERFDIGSTDFGVRQQIEEVRWTGAQIRVWGQLFTGVPATEARHVEVERIEIISGPAEEARNLAPFAMPSSSSHLPTDRGGQYQAWMATDGALETSWVEGVAGPGVGEWIELSFPGTIEVHSIGLDVGYDQDAGIFARNNRIKKVTLIFSSGEQVELGFADIRGVQTIPLVRAPGSNIETTYVRVVIDEVYPGSQYDDTCLAEIEVWGTAR